LIYTENSSIFLGFVFKCERQIIWFNRFYEYDLTLSLWTILIFIRRCITPANFESSELSKVSMNIKETTMLLNWNWTHVYCMLYNIKIMKIYIFVLLENVLDRIINASWRIGLPVVRPIINDLVASAFTKIWNDAFSNFDFNLILP